MDMTRSITTPAFAASLSVRTWQFSWPGNVPTPKSNREPVGPGKRWCRQLALAPSRSIGLPALSLHCFGAPSKQRNKRRQTQELGQVPRSPREHANHACEDGISYLAASSSRMATTRRFSWGKNPLSNPALFLPLMAPSADECPAPSPVLRFYTPPTGCRSPPRPPKLINRESTTRRNRKGPRASKRRRPARAAQNLLRQGFGLASLSVFKAPRMPAELRGCLTNRRTCPPTNCILL